jgi:HEPN domain-containing protein
MNKLMLCGFPRTHSIGVLLALLEEAGISGVQDLIDATGLTRYAVSTRYPGEEEPVGKADAQEAAALATRVFDWVIAQLPASDQAMRSA